MHVLQTAIAVIGRRDCEIALVARAPRLRQIFHRKLALEQFELEIEPQDDVEIVGHLVGVGADERARDLVDGAIEGLTRNLSQLLRKLLLQFRIILLPEIPAAPDQIFP